MMTENTTYATDAILSKIPLPLMITNNDSRKIVFANEFASEVYGIELEKLIGSSIDVIYTDKEQQNRILKAMQKDGSLKNFKTQYKKSDGKIIEAMLSIIPITYQEQMCRMGVISDITELQIAQDELLYLNKTLEQRVQEEVEKNEKQQLVLFAQSRHAQMGEMISMIAHQWRQPLNILSLLVQKTFLKYKKDQMNLEKLETFTHKVMDQIFNMTNTIEDFRNFFKPNKTIEKFNLYESLKNSQKLISALLKQSDITLKINCKEDIQLKGYPNEFGQAVINIIKNAHDALMETDQENKLISINAITDENLVKISIKDNAGGIDEKLFKNIFLPYFSTKEKNGTGLGLYMTKMIIEEHMKGNVALHNDKDGAVFTIVINNFRETN